MMSRQRNKSFALGRLKSGEMNKTEKAYHDYLRLLSCSGDIKWFKFEGMKFRLADNTFYTPDFCVMNDDGSMECHEVKGSLTYIQDDAMVKIKVAAEMYPFRFILIAPLPKNKGGGWQTRSIGNGKDKCGGA